MCILILPLSDAFMLCSIATLLPKFKRLATIDIQGDLKWGLQFWVEHPVCAPLKVLRGKGVHYVLGDNAISFSGLHVFEGILGDFNDLSKVGHT